MFSKTESESIWLGLIATIITTWYMFDTHRQVADTRRQVSEILRNQNREVKTNATGK